VDQWAADQRAANNNRNQSVTSSTRPTITPATQTVRNADGSETQQTVYNVGAGTIVTEEFNSEAARRGVGGGLVPTTAAGNNFFTGVFRKGDIGAAVQLLDQFGDAKVLSSPRISALNNQPALLRVVDQEVYFNIEVDDEYNETTGTLSGRSYTVEENTVDVGFVMNVFPNISDDGEIILNLKPSVTRVLNYRKVPSPSLPGGVTTGTSTDNVIPITRIRELESLISLRDGEVAVMGGLLEDRTGDNSSSVPGISKLPGVGTLFEKKEQKTYKTEFIVFLRARIITNPSVNGDYSDYRHLLPDTDFILRDTGSYPVVPGQEDPR
jgi:general secretion pathway protein D